MSETAAPQQPGPGQLVVKVCGIRRRSDAKACAAAGADFAGLNRVAASRRCIGLADCAALVDELQSCAAAGLDSVEPVLVYRDCPRSQILSEAAKLGVQWVQLHGSESQDTALALQSSGLRVIRALPGSNSQASLEEWLDCADVVLLDGQEAGSGQPWAWSVPQGVDLERIWLAGGLTALNVDQALAQVPAAGVDAASGLETDGALDPVKIHQFVKRAKQAAR